MTCFVLFRGGGDGDDTAGLLNLPPDSKDAQVFEQYAKQAAAAQGGAPGKFHVLHSPRFLQSPCIYMYMVVGKKRWSPVSQKRKEKKNDRVTCTTCHTNA